MSPFLPALNTISPGQAFATSHPDKPLSIYFCPKSLFLAEARPYHLKHGLVTSLTCSHNFPWLLEQRLISFNSRQDLSWASHAIYLFSPVLPMSRIPCHAPVKLYNSQWPLRTCCFMPFRILAFFLRMPGAPFKSLFSHPSQSCPNPSSATSLALRPDEPSVFELPEPFCAPLVPRPTLVYEWARRNWVWHACVWTMQWERNEVLPCWCWIYTLINPMYQKLSGTVL